ncbi:MAG: head-tail adaptor protein [Ruminococcus sp.]|nr:head-tail adaptor protein [Ruminococcus sp.]
MMRVYDKPIIIQRLFDNGEWLPWRQLLAFVNKSKDSTSSLTFELPYTRSLKEIFSYMEEFLIIYRDDVFLIEDYDDYMESHLTVRLKATILRLGKFTSNLTILQKVKKQDDDGFTSQTETAVATVPCYHERRDASTRWDHLTTFAEVTDLFQIKKLPEVELSRSYLIEHGGDRFEILYIEPIKGRGVYLQILARCISGAVR